jgi:hypothetical protein
LPPDDREQADDLEQLIATATTVPPTPSGYIDHAATPRSGRARWASAGRVMVVGAATRIRRAAHLALTRLTADESDG